MKEAGIEITFRQSFFSDPAVPVKNLKVGWWGLVGPVCKGLGEGEQWWVGKEAGRDRLDFFFFLVLKCN